MLEICCIIECLPQKPAYVKELSEKSKNSNVVRVPTTSGTFVNLFDLRHRELRFTKDDKDEGRSVRLLLPNGLVLN